MEIANKAKCLFIDIETSPLVCYTWGLYEQNVIKKIRQSQILSFAYKWGDGLTKVIACDSCSEKELLNKLHDLLDEADVVIAHNGDSFDIKKINTRFIINKIPQPSPYKTIDTKKEIKKVAAFDSNSLDNLGKDLSEGEKIKHRGFDMWEGCMAGNRRDWSDMKRYNKKDVDLLFSVFNRLKGWFKGSTDLRVFSQDFSKCPRCESSNVTLRGFNFSKTGKRQRFMCKDCGSWFSGKKV